jgi:DHA2 family methylenomycin A resistance protein-like MFS transporter
MPTIRPGLSDPLPHAPPPAPTRAARLTPFIAATSLGYFVVQLDVSIVNLSLPALQQAFQAGIPILQWIVNTYTLAFSVALLSAGVLGDRYGNRAFLMLGYALFALASLACAVAPDAPLMLAARVAQGLGAALVVPNSLAVINQRFVDDEPTRVSLVSGWVTFGGVALTCGPLIGGLINAFASWRWIFVINLPICALGLLLAARHVDAAPRRTTAPLDWLGQGLLLACATALLVLIINHAALSRDAQLALLAATFGAFGAFLAVEHRHAHPAIPLGIFGNPGLQQGLVYGGLINFAYFGIVFFASLYFRGQLGMSAARAGLAFIPITLPLVLGNQAGARIARARGPERAIVTGFMLMIPGLLLLALPALRHGYLAMLPAFALTTFGIGFIPPLVTAIAMRSVGPERGGMVSGLVNFFRQIAGAFGVAVFGGFVAPTHGATGYAAFSLALVAIALVLLVAIGAFAAAARRAARA